MVWEEVCGSCGVYKNDEGIVLGLRIWGEVVCEEGEDLIVCFGFVKERGIKYCLLILFFLGK